MQDFTRRDLLKGTAAAAIGLAAGGASAALKQPATVTGADRLRIGIVGAGGKGWSGMEQAAEQGDIVAICDIDVVSRTKAMIQHPRAASFDDYRTMYKALRGELDAVVISTPDHHHAPAAALAMNQGLHVYCEKPLTRTIWEARQLQNIAQRRRVASQMGNQSTASTELRKMAALIAKGTYGHVKEIHLWTDRAGGWWKQGVPRPAAVAEIPKNLNFDLWLGPRPDRPYADGYHPFAWRGWWDFGCGALGDIGCHNVNLPFQALDLRDPISVQAETSGHNKDSYPQWSIVRYEFGARGDRGPVTMFWYDSGKRPPVELAHGETLAGNGCIVVCEHATLYSAGEYGGAMHLAGGGALPRSSNFVHSPGHFQEWVESMESGKPTGSDIVGISGPLTETVLLGNLAVWASGEKLEWDARNLRVKGRPEFDAVIRPAYRPGWTL